MSKGIPWPDWQVDNALAILREARDRHQSKAEFPKTVSDPVNKAIVHALDLGISAIEGIPQHTPPTPEPLKVSWNRLVRRAAKDLGNLLHGVADSVEDFGRWHFDNCRCEDYYD